MRVAFAILLLVANSALAKVHDCTGREFIGGLCETPLATLHPTQFAVGLIAADSKAENLSKLSSDKLRDYIEDHPAPAVYGPDGLYYIVDHHHLALALTKLGKKKMVVKIKRYFVEGSKDEFWQMMAENKWVYPFDEYGRGPMDPAAIPSNLLGMRDDPYRSLAWAVREAEGYEKTTAPFAEFKWAEFFRERVAIATGKEGFQKAVKEALELAGSKAARGLPGYIGGGE